MDEQRMDASLAHALDDWYVRIGRQFGPLSRPQRRILRLIASAPGLRVGDVAEQLGLTTAGATRMVDKLENLGFAYRFRAPGEDQRHVHVAPTPAGMQALGEADRLFARAVGASLVPLTAEERATLARLLVKIRDATPVGSLQSSAAPTADTVEVGNRG